MSAITDQFNCERMMIAQLALQSDLTALNSAGGIVHYDTDAQTSATSIDHIVVQGMPRAVHTYGIDLSTPVLFSVMVKVTIYLVTNSSTTLDTYLAAIQSACTGTTPPASIVTLATSLFGTSRGFRWFYSDEGERSDTDNERMATQTWQAIFGA